MIYGYARVSTTGQEQNGNSLADQEKKLEDAGAQVVYADAFTGKTMQRPEFSKLLAALQGGDTLICTKLDRFARTATEGAQIVQELLQKGVTVHILNMGVVDDSPIGRWCKCSYRSQSLSVRRSWNAPRRGEGSLWKTGWRWAARPSMPPQK